MASQHSGVRHRRMVGTAVPLRGEGGKEVVTNQYDAASANGNSIVYENGCSAQYDAINQVTNIIQM